MASAALAFGTLFLGLIAGPRPVEVLVAPPVVEVEVRLDGRKVGSLQQPPWRAIVDFGAELLPHRLEAIGRDSTGREVARTLQRVNQPRPPAEVEVVLEREGDGRVNGALLSWQMTRNRAPRSIQADLDGVPLQVELSRRLVWPPSTPDEVHLLKVAVDFGEGAVAHREVVFGLDVSAEAGSTLTGLALEYLRAGDAPKLAELRGVVMVQGRPAPVVALEKGCVRLAVVLDSRARAPWQDILRKVAVTEWPMGGYDTVLSVATAPTVQRLSADQTHNIYDVLSLESIRVGDLFRILMHLRRQLGRPEGADVANAVSVAGLMASASNQRRAVLLILGDADRAGDGGPIQLARGFLRAIGVPLIVWSPVQDAVRSPEGPWGQITDVTTPGDLRDAENLLQKTLRRQRVVWLDGDLLAQDVTLVQGCTRYRIAGRQERGQVARAPGAQAGE